MKLRKALMATADKPKKYKEDYGSDESDLDDDWIQSHEANLVVLEREKIKKKFDKENVKLAESNEKALPQKELDKRLEAADELAKTIKKERKAKYTESKLNEEKLVAALKKMDERIAVQKTNALDKDEGKGASSFCFFSPSPSSLTDPLVASSITQKSPLARQRSTTSTLVSRSLGARRTMFQSTRSLRRPCWRSSLGR
jgi:DNA topoisomerase-1